MMGKSGRKLHGQVGHSGTCNFLLKFLFYSQDFVADAPAIYIIFVFLPYFLVLRKFVLFFGGARRGARFGEADTEYPR